MIATRGRRRRRLHGAAGVVLVAALAAALTGCPGDTATETEPTTNTTTEPTETGSSEPVGDRLVDFYQQQVAWEACADEELECATIEVPLDYDEPAAGTVELALNRRPADGESPVGSLIVNPGGPGVSGVDYVPQVSAQLGADVLAAYDIVGFDPRGVARSDPVECLDDEGVDRLLAADLDPDTATEVAGIQNLLEEFAAGCQEDAADLLPHLSTTAVARDLDVIRAVVGDDVLHYYGASYGTFIGAVHAELFPDRVGRVVLDGAVDPSLDIEEVNKQQAVGFETALRAYVSACVAKPDCPLGADLDQGVQRIQAFLDELDSDPLETGSDRELTQSLGFYGIALPLYVEDYWPILDQALTQAFDGDGATLLDLADAYWHRSADGYLDNLAQAIYAVNCLDDPVDTSIAEIERSIPELEQASPTFGRSFAWSPLACEKWPVKPSAPVPGVDAEGADPILVVGTTRDPATPYRWAEALAAQLESAVLLTRVGDGHTAYGVGNECIDSTVDSYLVEGEVPAAGTRC